MAPIDPHSAGETLFARALQGARAWLLAQCDAAYGSLSVSGEVEQDTAPAASNVQHLLARTNREELTDAREFSALCRFEVVALIEKDSGRIGQLAVEHQ